MNRFIIAVPFILGIILVLAGIIKILVRTGGTVHTEGIITDIAKTCRKYARVKMTLEAPVVKYTVKGVEYSGISSRFFAEGIINFKKGSKIKIRVSKRNYRKFVPEESGMIVEKMMIACGVFVIFAIGIMLWRYGV